MGRVEDVDGVKDGTVKTYFNQLVDAHQKADLPAVTRLSAEYLGKSVDPSSPLAAITALTTQAAVQLNVKERLDLLKYIQDGLRQIVSNAAELDVVLITRWPMWAYLHVGVDVFSD